MFGIVGLPLFHFGKVTIGALQLFAPLAAVFVVGPPCQVGALFSLPSEEFRRSHIESLPEFSGIALQHSPSRNATKFLDMQILLHRGHFAEWDPPKFADYKTSAETRRKPVS